MKVFAIFKNAFYFNYRIYAKLYRFVFPTTI